MKYLIKSIVFLEVEASHRKVAIPACERACAFSGSTWFTLRVKRIKKMIEFYVKCFLFIEFVSGSRTSVCIAVQMHNDYETVIDITLICVSRNINDHIECILFILLHYIISPDFYTTCTYKYHIFTKTTAIN
jgi:hypothetical protein